MRSAITFRSLDIGSVRPRSSAAAGGIGAIRVVGVEVGATCGFDSTGRSTGIETGAIVAGVFKMSSFRIRPPTPVPVTVDKSTPRSAAILRTNGVAYAPVLEGAAVCAALGTGIRNGADGSKLRANECNSVFDNCNFQEHT